MKIDSLLIKPAGPDCNIQCEYCFYTRNSEMFPENVAHRMSEQTLKKVITEFLAICGEQASISWQGGEPTLMELAYFEKAIWLIKNHKLANQKLMLSLQTNGMLLSNDWVHFLKRNNFLVGLSVDGPEPIHDTYRVTKTGNPTHEWVAKSMELLKSFEVPFNTLTVVSKGNVDRAEEIFEYLLTAGSGYMQFIPCVEFSSKHPKQLMPYSITPEQYGRFLCNLFDCWIGAGQPRSYIRLFDEMLISYVEYRSPSCHFSPQCSVNLVVEYDGSLYPCDFFVNDRWYLGNINGSHLAEIAASERLDRFVKGKQKLDKCCGQCRWYSLCFGDCLKYRYGENGETVNFSYFCKAYQIFFAYAHPRMLAIKKRLLSRFDPRAAGWNRLNRAERNSACVCGSGRKFKQCCEIKKI